MLAITWETETITQSSEGDLAATVVFHTLEFDAVTREQHIASALVTEHAVEGAVAVADHKRPEPRRITVETYVSNTPIGPPPASGYGPLDGPAASVGKAESGGTVRIFSDPFDRIGDVWATLQRLVSESTILSVSTRYQTYDNVVLISVDTPRTGGQGAGDFVTATLDFKEVRIAETSLADVPRPREPRAQAQVDAGAQEGTRQSQISLLGEGYEAYQNAEGDVWDRLGAAAGAIMGGNR